jgi:hypothetical protein
MKNSGILKDSRDVISIKLQGGYILNESIMIATLGRIVLCSYGKVHRYAYVTSAVEATSGLR